MHVCGMLMMLGILLSISLVKISNFAFFQSVPSRISNSAYDARRLRHLFVHILINGNEDEYVASAKSGRDWHMLHESAQQDATGLAFLHHMQGKNGVAS